MQAERFGVQVRAVLKVLQRPQGEIQEVAGAARGIEDPEVLQSLKVAQKQRLRLLAGLLRALPAGLVLLDQRTDLGLGGLPSALQRLDNDGADQLHDGARVGVVRAQRRADFRIKTDRGPTG